MPSIGILLKLTSNIYETNISLSKSSLLSKCAHLIPDVHGKVVHLVQRPPPGQNPRSNNRSASPQPQQRRVYRPYRMEQGNAMYLGSMAFPGNLMESQGIVPPPPTHSLTGSRLNVARR